MSKALVIEDIPKDVERLCGILAAEGLEALVCQTGSEAEAALRAPTKTFAVVFLSVEVLGPPFGMELIVRCRKTHPETPIIVVSSALDAGVAVRAAALGARDFLERPLDEGRLRACLRGLLKRSDPLKPVLDQIRAVQLGSGGERLVGESPAFLDVLREVARVLPHKDPRVLILGESGTGKELLARAIHMLGPRAAKPLVSLNIGEIPQTLVEDALFGHERGAFTDARESKQGLLETASDGTLFLDEIGDLDLSVQGKLLRAVQEREFRRLGGNAPVKFNAGLVCATNRDLGKAMQQGTFRRDLFHRIAEVVIQIPPLRDRSGDIVPLLEHTLAAYNGGKRSLHFARETLAILRSYSFPGNVRELQNVVKSALIQCDGDLILPSHLPLKNMVERATETVATGEANPDIDPLLAALVASLPRNWIDAPYRQVIRRLEQAFDRIYLQHLLTKSRHNITGAAKLAGWDTKTFRKHWKECDLPPLGGDEEVDG